MLSSSCPFIPFSTVATCDQQRAGRELPSRYKIVARNMRAACWQSHSLAARKRPRSPPGSGAASKGSMARRPAGLAAAGSASHIRAMPLTANPDWPQIALYALGGALLLMLLFRLPVLGRLLRFAFSLGLLAIALFILVQQAPYQPQLGQVAERLGLDPQEVRGQEVRIRMARDGHFWADATINGVRRRMLIDSGATVTAISER